MYKIILQRKKEYENVNKPEKEGRKYKTESSTIGELSIQDESEKEIFKCVTCENGGESTDTPNQDKRIIARVYKIYWTQSSVALPKDFKPKCISLYTDELPSFKERRIHIHIGNYPQDTEGCLLLGYTDSGDGTISQSTKAVSDFYNIVKSNEIQDFTLEIREIE